MTPDDLYETWKRRRTRIEAPGGFADRVMESVHAHGNERVLVVGFFIAFAASKMGRLSICGLACVACVFRILMLLSVFAVS